jgi:AcrR family transcriptional regulator
MAKTGAKTRKTRAVAGKRLTRPAARKARGEGSVRREEILAAAKDILLADGYEGVSIRKVAARIGISSTAIYLYFKEKDELLDTICHEVFAGLVAPMDALLAAPAPPLDRMRLGLTAYLKFCLAHPDEYRVVFLTHRPNNGWDHRAPLRYVDRWGHARVNTFMFLVEGLRQCMEAGQIRRADPMTLAETVLAAQHGLLALLILCPEQQWQPREVLIHENVELILRGLAPGEPGR